MWRLAICTAALLLARCTETHSYRYRVTVEVDTPQGLRTGSSVWETKAWEGSGIPDTAIRSREKGEAVAVDLPGGTLFGVMRAPDLEYDYTAGLVEGHLRKHPIAGISMGKDWKENRRQIARAMPAFDLHPDEYPLLVRFREASDPASVEAIHPNLLASSFGHGVSLRRITIQVTDDAVTKSLDERLPWLASQKGVLERAPRMTPMSEKPLASRLHDGDFRMGIDD